ncbi:MAG TPA: TerC family protein [Leptospiraceae bacterium]|nr:TerC family protein [Leptospiraceae bacterium]HMY45354.1 TerC family protein [Leptospiraceae bacterium]HMZ37552.1 TerC family protein [Leptospiraceae bacterium]HNE24414.1 TerC family protein [Leptospiraceae bacterium]
MDLLFPFQEYWWFYAGFTGFVLLLLTLDLGVFHKEAHAVSYREAGIWSAVWIALALAFNALFYFYSSWKFAQIGLADAEGEARRVALEFLSGYLIEKSLSIDNIFVFILIFGYFAIPQKYQHRVLFFGIIGALVFRAAFVAIGAALMQFHWVIYLFGGFLILTGLKMAFAQEKEMDLSDNLAMKLFKKILPATHDLHGSKFLVKINGIRHATPLLLALIFVEISDIIFAVDSVPAIFAITKEPLIVFTSNVFAILGLRSLFFLLAGSSDKFHLLKYGLAVVLVFVGLKMVWLNDAFGGKFPISWSLGIILGTIALFMLLSVLFPEKKKANSG